MNFVMPYIGNGSVPASALRLALNDPALVCQSKISMESEDERANVPISFSLTMRIAPNDTTTMRDFEALSLSRRSCVR